MFTFKVHPAAVSVTDGIQHAFDYLGTNWRSWWPVVAVLALADFVFFMALASIAEDGFYVVNEMTNEIKMVPNAGDLVLQLIPFVALYLLVAVAAQMTLTGIAVAGLRGWRLTASIVVRRGLVAVASYLIVTAAAFGALLVWAIVAVASGGLGILALFFLVPVAVYASLRLQFVGFAIFEGFGPVGGLQESWRLSQGAVLRIFGWALMSGLISIGFSIVGTIASAPLSSSSPAGIGLGQGISGAVTGVYSVFGVFFMAVLYESQRARLDPSLYPMPAYPYPVPQPVYPGVVPPGSYPPPYPYAQPGGPAPAG
jgi:hypothetical protein